MNIESNIKKNRKVCVLGLGYVGLTLSATLSDLGLQIIGIDKDSKLISDLKKRKPHFHEKGLKQLLDTISKNKYPPQYIDKLDKPCAEIYIITVGTPILKPSLKPNIDYVRSATTEVANVLKKDDLVILRSTVPVGTTRNVVLPILEEKSGLKAGKDFSIAFCPERTIEGKALKELRELPQIIGGYDTKSVNIARSLFNIVTQTIINVETIESAEMLKILDNTYRDMMFAYANQMALLCNELNLNMVPIVRAANQGYNRNNIPVPSPGVGGACLSKDPYILADVCNQAGVDSTLIVQGRKINEFMPIHVINRLYDSLNNEMPEKSNYKIFVLGFAFKGAPETSDMRNSPTIDLVNELKSRNATIFGHDPLVDVNEIESLGVKCTSLEEGFKESDAVIVMTNHQYYEDLNLMKYFNSKDKKTVLLDGWSIFDDKTINSTKNLTYLSI